MSFSAVPFGGSFESQPFPSAESSVPEPMKASNHLDPSIPIIRQCGVDFDEVTRTCHNLTPNCHNLTRNCHPRIS
jgi:hypothetical protein